MKRKKIILLIMKSLALISMLIALPILGLTLIFYSWIHILSIISGWILGLIVFELLVLTSTSAIITSTIWHRLALTASLIIIGICGIAVSYLSFLNILYVNMILIGISIVFISLITLFILIKKQSFH